jgi:hypothetical protein
MEYVQLDLGKKGIYVGQHDAHLQAGEGQYWRFAYIYYIADCLGMGRFPLYGGVLLTTGASLFAAEGTSLGG